MLPIHFFGLSSRDNRDLLHFSRFCPICHHQNSIFLGFYGSQSVDVAANFMSIFKAQIKFLVSIIMKQTLQIALLFISALFYQTVCQKAYLLTSSVGYYNYRQIANALQIYNWLKKLGYQDHNIVLSFPENVGCCQKNALQGSISFRDQSYQNINKNFELDYKYDQMNAESVANSMIMKYPYQTLNFRKLKLNDEPYYIYMTGHGGDFYFKIRERQALISQNYQQMFKDMSMRTNASVFLMSDSCSAVTPFEQIEWENFIALGSSSKGEKSLSMGYDKVLNGPKADEFTYYLSQHFTMINPVKSNTTLKQIWQYMDFQKLAVHSKLTSSNRRNKNRLMKEFVVRQPRISKFGKSLVVPTEFLDYLDKDS